MARLVAAGLTNREIGARLSVSSRTVETHLSHVFAKLGVPSRAGVAAEVARRSRGEAWSGRWTALTPAEAVVARGVTAGLTNREIGAALYVSPRTVETHISRIFAKSGLTTRASVAAALARPEDRP